MRVALLNQYYEPADAPTAVLLADVGRALARRGHEVYAIASRRDYNDPAHRLASRDRVGGVEVRRVRATGFGRGRTLGRLADYLSFLAGAAWTLLRLPRPDVVVALTTPPMLARLALSVARRRRAKLVYWVMDVYPELAFELGVLGADGHAGRLLRRMSTTLLTEADRVVALGETMAGRLRDAGARRITVIHNWCDGEQVRPRPAAGHALRRELGWEDRFVVLYSGNLGLAHDFETVLGAARRLAGRDEIRFAFVGGGPRRPELERRVREGGMSNVELHPWVPAERLGEGLTSGDLHLVTLRDGLAGLLVPSKIYGILAAGRPTLYVGPPCEITEILDEGRCGVRIEGGDDAALAAAIEAYADDSERRLAEGRRARALFEERFERARATATFVDRIEAEAAERHR